MNSKDQTIRINISPTDILIDDADDPEIITLTGSGSPLVISTVNNDEDKFQPIRSKQAKIEFISDTGAALNISTFSVGPDNLWVVDIILFDTLEYIFRGYLIMADNQQPFLPDPNVVVLTATDHLGALKETALVDFNDENPSGKYRIADIIAMCLRKTELSLNISVVNNLRAGTGATLVDVCNFSSVSSYIFFPSVKQPKFYLGQKFTVDSALNSGTIFTVLETNQGSNVLVSPTPVHEGPVFNITFTDEQQGHFYDNVYIDVKTFEKEIGLSEDCYTVLEKILGQDSFVTQWDGKWWIMRIDEVDDNLVYVANFLANGDFVDFDAGTTINKSVGAAEESKFANADTLLRFIRPHNYIKETYDYIYPLEIPCNVDFVRGDLITTVSAYEKHYNLDCWTLKFTGAMTGDPTTASTYIKRLFDDNGYESGRAAVITPSTSFNSDEVIQSEAIPIGQKDKITLSVDYRFDSNLTGGSISYALIHCYIIADDGTYYYIVDTPINGKYDWATTGGTVDFGFLSETWVRDDVVETDTATASYELLPAPVAGDLYICLHQINQYSGAEDTQNINYSNLRVDIISYINNSYDRYSGQYNQTNRPETGYLAKQENQVYLSDSPKKIFKGAMFIQDFIELWNDTTEFYATSNTIQVLGDQTAIFKVGMVIKITGTASNNITTTITSVSYSIIVGDTVIGVDGTLVTETITAVIYVGIYKLFPSWYDVSKFLGVSPANQTDINSFGYFQVYAVMNQFSGSGTTRANGANIFKGSVYGYGNDWPDLLHKYSLTDANPETDNRYFMLISFSQDWRTCIMDATFAEVYDTTVGKVYTYTLTFKYIAQ